VARAVRLAALLVLAVLLAGCMPTDPAGLRAAAAGMEQATQEAVGLLSVERQYTQAARDADATATQAAVTQQVSAARATLEMAAAQRAANAQALDNLSATATLAAQQTEIAAAPTRAAATATRQAETEYRNQALSEGLTLLGALLAIFATAIAIWIMFELGKAVGISIQAWAARRKVEALKSALVETSGGLKYIDAHSGEARTVPQPGAIPDPQPEPEPRASEIRSAPAIPVNHSPRIGELEYFVSKAIRKIGGDADYIPRHDVMGMSGEAWTLRMDRLTALGFIPARAQGKRSTLYAKETLALLLARVHEYETAPSPTGGDAKKRA